jgi:hypothetical protein
LNEQAHSMLDLLHTARWFVSVGQPLDSSVRQAQSWQEADSLCADIDWSNALLEGRNEITATIANHFEDYPKPWNETVDYVTMIIKPMIAHKASPIQEQYSLSPAFLDSIRHAVLGMVMAAHYADLYRSAFYADLADWYIKGHFPCGWEGDYPQGRLIVY